MCTNGSKDSGCERHDREALRREFERLERLGRNLSITVNDVRVKGVPHNTVGIIRWTATDTFPDGFLYCNHGVDIVRMRWAKIVENRSE